MCSTCNKCHECCLKSACRGPTSKLLANLVGEGCRTENNSNPERGLHPPLSDPAKPHKVPHCHKPLCQSPQEQLPVGGITSAYGQKCNRASPKSNIFRVFQPTFSGTQTQQQVETHTRPKQTKSLPQGGKVQNGDTGNHQDIPPTRGVGNLSRLQGCLLPYTNTGTVQEISQISCPGSDLPVQGTALWSVHSTHGVHCIGKGGETDGHTQGYKDPPVPRRLVGQSRNPPSLSPAYPDPDQDVPGSRLASKFRKIGTGAPTGIQLCRLPVRPQVRPGQTDTGPVAEPSRENPNTTFTTGLSSPAVHVLDRSVNGHRETSSPRPFTHETHTVASQKQLESTGIPGKSYSSTQIPAPTFTVVARRKQCASRSAITPHTACSANFYRRIKRRVGRSFKRVHCKRVLVSAGKQAAHKLSGTKSSTLSPKRVPKPLHKPDCPSGHRQYYSSGLHKQRRGNEVGPTVCPTMEDARPTQLADTALQSDPSQKSDKSKSPCLAPRATKIKEQGFSEAVAARIEAPQRRSTRSVYEAKWAIFTKWCLTNQVDFRAPPLKSVADFLMHLFEDKKLQPSTIDGYRSAIADKLGNTAINISKDDNLTRLLESFHRDRPKGRRGIPSWNLSLVLHQLTKAPFEPLREASLKHLTFKTVFLLALGSGKRRSEIHAWQHQNIRHQSDWSKVSLFPSPSFLSKNQLAKEGPQSVAPVVIPALAPTLDKSLKSDRSLCPVRALRYYLDRTSDLRQHQQLVFVSFKKGFDKDISPATISSWIKQTVILCYELSDHQTHTLHQVKAHDVRAFAASKAFQSGVSLEQILAACHWKSHNTFTQFYLKDVAWADSELYHLGPVVAAQQIHQQAGT